VHLVCLLADVETISFEEAVRVQKWKDVMDKEMKAIEKNKTWDMTDLPKGRKPFETAIYVKSYKDELLIVVLYVDDLIFMGNSQRLIDEFE
jgi:transposase